MRRSQTSTTDGPCTIKARHWLRQAVMRGLSETERRWMTDRIQRLEDDRAGFDPRAFDTSFGLIPRKLGKRRFELSPTERDHMDSLLPGWRADRWTLDQAARIVLLTCLEHDRLVEQLERLLRHADLGEQLTLFQGLPLYPASERVQQQAAAGLRTNMRAVFEAIAHHNPWPADCLDEHRWNHLVLKALFIDSSLHPIHGLDERANPELARMLLDYAHERRAAGRRITGELWRCAVPYVTLDQLEPFLPVADLGGHWPASIETAGLSLALYQSPDSALQALARQHAPQIEQIEAGLFNWTSVYRQEHCRS